MPYNNPKLASALTDFRLQESYFPLFTDLEPIVPSDHLNLAIQSGQRIAIPGGGSKARSEFLVAPVLLELSCHYGDRLAVYSGCELSANLPDAGYYENYDFLLAQGVRRLTVSSPTLPLTFSNTDAMEKDFAQLVRQMVVVQYFQKQEAQTDADSSSAIKSKHLGTVFGCVTTGEVWQFLRLEGNKLTIDRDRFYVERLDRLLACFHFCLDQTLGE